MSTTLAKRGPQGIAARPDGWTQKEIDLIKATCAADLTGDEFEAFVYVARERGLNPLKKEIYAIRRGGKVTHQTGIDGFRVTAARTKVHAGTDDAVFTGEPGKAGFRATVTVWKLVGGVRCPFVATARWEEYNPGQGLWKTMPHGQLAKCAESLALRKAFPESLAGLYTSEEMAQADVVDVQATVPGTLKDMPALPPGVLKPVGGDLSDQIRAAAKPPADAKRVAAGFERAAKSAKAKAAGRAAAAATAAAPPEEHEPWCGCDRCMVPGDQPAPPAALTNTDSIKAIETGPKISRDQQKLLFAVAKEQGLSHDQLKVLVKQRVGVDSTSDILASWFTKLISFIEGRPDPEPEGVIA
jgi:phage recombination protein Bet